MQVIEGKIFYKILAKKENDSINSLKKFIESKGGLFAASKESYQLKDSELKIKISDEQIVLLFECLLNATEFKQYTKELLRW